MQKLSILIVDDSLEDRYILKRMLKELELESDIHIFEKTDGKQAIEFMKAFEENNKAYPDDFPPIITFLDINMPLLDGHEYLSEFSKIRPIYQMQNCVVMMFSSSARDDDYNRAMQYDFVKGFLVKGLFTNEDLKKTIKKVIE